MTLLLLLIVSVLLALGMVLLPPVTGAGLGSLVTRSWLILGVLVFSGHYLSYLAQGERARLRATSAKPRARYRSVQHGERSAGHR